MPQNNYIDLPVLGGGGGGGITSINGNSTAAQIIAGSAGGVHVSSSAGTTTLSTEAHNTEILDLTGGNTNKTVDPANYYLWAPGPFISVDWSGRYLNDENNVRSLLWTGSERYLLDTGGIRSVDWGLRTLLQNDITGPVASLDWGGFRLIGSDLNPSLDWNNKFLITGSNVTSLDWASRLLFNSGANAVANWNDQTLLDGSSQLSVHWANRTLNSSLNTIVCDWSVFRLYDNSSNLAFDWSERSMYDTSGNPVFATADGYLNLFGYQIGIEQNGSHWLLSWPTSVPSAGYLSWDGGGTVSTGSFDGTPNSISYTPGSSGSWAGDPSTVQQALDRIASAVAAFTGNPIP